MIGNKIKSEYLQVFSRHPTHGVIRRKIKVPVASSIRFGSTTRTVNGKKYKVELNSPEAVQTSSDKLLMKFAFRKNEVKTASWIPNCEVYNIEKEPGKKEEKIFLVIGDKRLKFPIVTKHRFGSRGTGNKIHFTEEEFVTWHKAHAGRYEEYIVEQYMNYSKEYRLHVTEQGCFYTCRKALKSDTPDNLKWFRNDSNSVWILEDNPEFNKPDNWSQIVEESIKALVAVGLDVGAVDLRVQDRENPDFFIVEINSAPSFGEITAQKYEAELPKLVLHKLAK